MSTELLCLICARTLPEGARDGETIGPLFCHHHELGRLQEAGVLGIPMAEHRTAPVTETSLVVAGSRILQVRYAPSPDCFLFELEHRGQLVIFASSYNTTFVQYVPGDLVRNEATSKLTVLQEASHTHGALLGVTTHGRLLAVEQGLSSAGSLLPEVIAFAFEDRSVLDIETIGYSYYDEGATFELAASWRS